MRKYTVFYTLFFFVLFFISCTAKELPGTPESENTERDYTWFAGKDIAMVTGGITYYSIMEIGASPVNYNDGTSATEDVRRGRVAGYMSALTGVQVMASQLDGFEAIPVPKEIFSGQVAAISHDQNVINRFNLFLAAIEADGTLAEMQGRWLSPALNLDEPIPEIPNTGENGSLRVAVSSDSIPYVYMVASGKFSGFSVELVLRFGAYEGKTVEFTDMDFGGLIPYILNKRADIAIANMGITEERKQSVLFTDPFFDEQHGILTLKQNSSTSAGTVGGTRDFTDFFGKRIGGLTGSIFYQTVEDTMKGTPVYYADLPAAVEDVRRGRIDGALESFILFKLMVEGYDNKNFTLLEVPPEVYYEPMGAISMNQDIIDRFNLFLAHITADGSLAQIQKRWLEDLDLESPMPDIPHENKNGVLRVAVSAQLPPFEFIGNNEELKGYLIELALRFAAHEDMDIEFADMDFVGLIPYILSRRADIAIAPMVNTEERRQSVIFTDPYYFDQYGMIVLNTAVNIIDHTRFIKWLKTGIERNLITDNRWHLIIEGLFVTLRISIWAQVFGTLFGGIVCYVLMRKNKYVKRLGNWYCALIRGTPIVVILMIAYYIIFSGTDLSNVFIAIAAFSLITAASVGTNLKSAIDTVDIVEIEAARGIGFSAFGAFTSVTLPQAVRRALPSYTGGFVELVKATAIVGYIAIQDLTRAGDIIRSRTYDAYFPLILVAIIYLFITTVCIKLFKYVLKKARSGITETKE